MNRRLRNALCWYRFVYCLLLFAGRSAEAIYHAALIFPPLYSLRCFERFALSTFFVCLPHALARFLVTARPGCESALFVSSSIRYPSDAPAGASAWGGCPVCALLILAGAERRLRKPGFRTLARFACSRVAALSPAPLVGECCSFLSSRPLNRRNGYLSLTQTDFS